MGRRSKGLNRQKRYPGKSGDSISFLLSDHCRTDLYFGKKTFIALPYKMGEYPVLLRELTCNANQGSCQSKVGIGEAHLAT